VVTAILIDYSVTKWEDVCLDWFEGLQIWAAQFIEELSDKFFNILQTSGLRVEVRKVATEILQKVGEETRDQIKFYCRMERNHSFSLTENEQRSLAKKVLTEVKRIVSGVDHEEYKDELNAIAGVYAYWSISSNRLIEIVPMICENAYALGFAEQLERSFIDKLGLTGPSGLDNCIRFAREEPEHRERREQLKSWLNIVDESLDALSVERD